MAKLRYADRVAEDIERIGLHLALHGVEDVYARVAQIFGGLDVLTLHPLIGRRVEAGQRELVIGQGSRGYVALYGYDSLDDEVVIAGLCAQREIGFDES